MSEPTSPDIKISRNPVTQEKVDQEVIRLHEKDPNASYPTTNRQARDRVAAKLVLKKVRKERDAAKEKITIDELTQLPNIRWFNEALRISTNKAARTLHESAQEKTEDSRSGNGFFLIIFDIDNFKSVNDERGHLAGDKVLKAIGQLEKRAEEPIARIGGDEFAQIINSGINEEDVGKLIGRYKKKFGELTKEAGLPPLTLSFGIAPYKKGFTEDMWIHAADNALYAAKNSGRNKVCITTDVTIDGKAESKELTITS